MYIEFKKTANVPAGFYCNGCSEVTFNADMDKPYCNIDYLLIRENKKGKLVKTENCLSRCRKHILNE